MLTQKLLSLLTFAALAIAAPQATDFHRKVSFKAYRAGSSSCTSEDPILQGDLADIGACVDLPPNMSGGPLYWKTADANLKVGLFLSDGCSGDYKPFMASYTPDGSGCEMVGDLQGSPTVGTYRSMKILADCKSQGGCQYGK